MTYKEFKKAYIACGMVLQSKRLRDEEKGEIEIRKSQECEHELNREV